MTRDGEAFEGVPVHRQRSESREKEDTDRLTQGKPDPCWLRSILYAHRPAFDLNGRSFNVPRTGRF